MGEKLVSLGVRNLSAMLDRKELASVIMVDGGRAVEIVTGDLSEYSCDPKEIASDFNTVFLSAILGIIAVGLTLTLFLLVVIAWYPDLYTSKHLSQESFRRR